MQVGSPNFMFFVAYPLIPWIAIMLLGFSLGRLFESPIEEQKKYLLVAGSVATLLFVVIRIINVYGDPVPWSSQKSGLYTFLSFINLSKYPPSLLFILLFLGITFLLLRFTDTAPEKLRHVVSVYGRVPMFYYLLHLYIIRIAVFIMVFTQGFAWKDLLFGPFQFGRPAQGSGISLGWIFVVWIGVVSLLYPLCKWYGKYKSKNYQNKPWLRYL
jgi:uncharacterized membrane protein